MKSPAISIVMPFRNAGRTIAATLCSITAQSERDFELIAVDDGSTDQSAAIAREAAARDVRIALITAQGRGLVAALNAGIAAARSDLIARMDADDEMHPQRLERQRRFLERHEDVALVGSRVATDTWRSLASQVRKASTSGAPISAGWRAQPWKRT